jgi:hypothetical protein
MTPNRIQSIAAGSPATAEEARELASMSQWRPMETAPRDGTRILIYRGCTGVEIGAYSVVGREQWLSEDNCTRYPSHWLPLPAAPEVPHA